jgi:hypothetical protein
VVASREGVGLDVEDLYYRAKIAMITGWEYEYIDTLGAVDVEAIMQVYEAEQKMAKPKPKAKKWR